VQYDPNVGVRKQAREAERVAAFNTIFAANWARVQHHVECVIDDEEEAADLVSEVFALAWLKLNERKPLGLVWLLRVADNKLKDRARTARAEGRALEALRSRTTGERSSDILDAIAVRHAIESVLTPREKRMVVLFYWDRLAAGEIAELLRCSQSVVFTSLSRARAKLEHELGLEDLPDASIARAANTLQTD
jgi:RNA polymerase sigma factor (sigma-70 family)